MTRKTSVFFLAVLLFQAAVAHAENIKNALNHKYKNHILALRSPFTWADQKLNSSGHSLNLAPSSSWLLYGGIYVEKLNLSRDTLRLQGRSPHSPMRKKMASRFSSASASPSK